MHFIYGFPATWSIFPPTNFVDLLNYFYIIFLLLSVWYHLLPACWHCDPEAEPSQKNLECIEISWYLKILILELGACHFANFLLFWKSRLWKHFCYKESVVPTKYCTNNFSLSSTVKPCQMNYLLFISCLGNQVSILYGRLEYISNLT